jgi:mannose-1-phosphate guanylyltransferase
MIALIMAGGAGTRFWPLSRNQFPKQFLTVVANKSMIRLTVDRLLKKIPIERIFIVTARNQVELICEHIPELPVENIIIEPFGMNTAPCIALSVHYIKRLYNDKETLMVLPSDHVIRREDLFLKSLELAEIPAKDGYLVTFGIIPHYPATGYGYIEAAEMYREGMFHVRQFKEKPDLETARQFLEKGGFYWNSGMFYWELATISKMYETLQPEMAEILNAIDKKWNEEGVDADISELYAKTPRIPVDIGIMEKADKRIVIPVSYDWSDVGSWRALSEISVTDGSGNTIKAANMEINSRNNYIYTDKFTALIGVEGLVVIETPDAILVAKKEDSEEVKKIVEKLQKEGKQELL